MSIPSAFGVEHSELEKGLREKAHDMSRTATRPARRARENVSEFRRAGRYTRGLQSTGFPRKEAIAHGRQAGEGATSGEQRAAKWGAKLGADIKKSEFGVEHSVVEKGIGSLLGTGAKLASDAAPKLAGGIGAATDHVNALNGKLQPLKAAVGGVKNTLGMGAKTAADSGGLKTIGQKISTNKGALAAGAGVGAVGTAALSRKNN